MRFVERSISKSTNPNDALNPIYINYLILYQNILIDNFSDLVQTIICHFSRSLMCSMTLVSIKFAIALEKVIRTSDSDLTENPYDQPGKRYECIPKGFSLI